MSLLETRGLEISIAGKPICKSLDFSLERGQVWGVLGGNGIGKTTLLNTLAGLHDYVGGEVLVDGLSLSRWKRSHLARRLGMLFQDSVDTFPSSVLDTVLIGRYPWLPLLAPAGEKDLAIATQALVAVSLLELKDRQVDTLSGGERRRLALATLMVQEPTIWLLDEPTNHLDMHHQISLLSLLLLRIDELEGGALMVLHDVNLLCRFCSHAMLMVSHENIICGPVAEVISESNLAALYNHPIRKLAAGERDYFFPQ